MLAFGLSASLFLSSTYTVTATENAAAESESSPENDSAEDSDADDGSDASGTPTAAAVSASWPSGPSVTAEAAILMEANTGAILYAKNIHDQHYPASTTKVLTALIAMEESQMNEMVEYSSEAVNSINWREDSNIGIKPGEAITMEQSLYGLMVGSGNECGNAIGEHISGSIEAFVEKMNQRAKELGCQNSHFVTTNGIHDDNHYTSAYDLALIAQQYFSHDLLCKMSNTLDYVIPASDTLSQKLIPYTKNKLLAGRQYAYDGLVGSKTGYTSIAQQNLVSCAERDGMKLICVVMKDSSPDQFTDTVNLFNFGFSNFKMVNVSENDTQYTVKSSGFFESAQDIFGNSAPLLSLDKEACVILPNDATLEDTQSTLTYDNLEKGQAALVTYTYNGEQVGTAPILLSTSVTSFDFEKDVSAAANGDEAAADGTGGSANDSAVGDGLASGADGSMASDSSASGSDSSAASDGSANSTDSSANGTDGSAASDGSNNSDAEQLSATDALGTPDSANTDNASSQASGDTSRSNAQENTVFLNVNTILFWVIGIAAAVILVLVILSAIHNHKLAKRRKAIMKRRRERSKEIIDFDRYTDSMNH